MAHPKLELSFSEPAHLPDSVSYRSMNFDARGQLILAGVDDEKNLIINDFKDEIIMLSHAKYAGYRFPRVQRFSDGRWLIVNLRSRTDELNATIFSADFQKLNAFSVGDAIEHVAVDREDRIWIGYFDESGGTGLLRFTHQGEVTYDFNKSSGHNIFDLYAMTIGQSDAVWVYPYTDFYLASISMDRVEIVLEQSPVPGANAIAIGADHAAFFGSYDNDDVYVCDLGTGAGRYVTIQTNGKALKRSQIATYGERVAVLQDGHVFHTQLADLVEAAAL